MAETTPRRPGLIAELQRRKVVRAAGVYAVTAWLLLQVGDVLVEPMRLPDYTQSLLLALALLGLPLVVILAWVFESSADGLVVDSGQGAPTSRSGRTADWLLVAAAVVLVGFSLVRTPGSSSAAPTSTQAAAEPVLAVLPFENLSPLPENAFFTAGVYEDILAQLGRVNAIRVIARSSIERLQPGLALVEVAGTLGASHIIEGSVRRDAGRVRIQVKLVEPATDVQIWAATYDRDLADVFAVQSEVATRIAEELQVELAGTALLQPGTQPISADTYDQLLLARQLLDSGRNSDVEAAIARLEAVTEAAPDFALGWALLSTALAASTSEAVWRGPVRTRAFAAAERALQLAPDSPDVQMAMGGLLRESVEGRATEALPYLERAVELAPTDAQALNRLGRALGALGEWERAGPYLARALALDPLNPFLLADHARALADHDPVRARQLVLRALLLAPDNPLVRANSAFTLLRTGDVTAMADALYEGLKLDPTNLAIGSFLAYQLTAFGEFEVADRLLQHYERVQPDHVLVRQRRCDWHLAQQDYAGALEVARNWRQRRPDEPDAHRYEGTALILLANAAESEEATAQARRLRQTALGHLRLAAAPYAHGDGTYTTIGQSAFELVLLGDAQRGLGDAEADRVFSALAAGLAGKEGDLMATTGSVRARALAETGRLEEALDVLDTSAAMGFNATWILNVSGGAFAEHVVNTPSYQSWRRRIAERNAAAVQQLRQDHPELFADTTDFAHL